MPSEKILEQKKQQVAQLAEDFKKANVGVLVNYEGITVDKDTKLRKQLREAGCEYKVVKNTLLGLAFQEAGIQGLEEHLHGATAIAYSENGYTDAPKILSDYAKDNENFTVKAGFIDGDMVDAKSIDDLAKLPPKEVLVAQVLGGLNGPIQGFAKDVYKRQGQAGAGGVCLRQPPRAHAHRHRPGRRAGRRFGLCAGCGRLHRRA